MLPVAVDAMGGDNAPDAVIAGVKLACERDIPIALAGNPDVLNMDGMSAGVEIIPATQAIPMDAEPGVSVRTMKDSSLNRAAEAIRNQKASAFVSAGNTGAVMASALIKIGRINGVIRPAIAIPFPVMDKQTPNLLLDCGANAECQPKWLMQFAKMGVVHIRDSYGLAEPRVGLMSIGEEAGKGSSLVKQTFDLLSESLWQKNLKCRFVGNVEGRDILADAADVIVTDGFTGNVILKTAEGVAAALTKSIGGVLSKMKPDLAELLISSLSPLYEKWDPSTTGGAVLLGVKGVCVISHGASSPQAICNAIILANDLARANTIDHLKTAIASE